MVASGSSVVHRFRRRARSTPSSIPTSTSSPPSRSPRDLLSSNARPLPLSFLAPPLPRRFAPPPSVVRGAPPTPERFARLSCLSADPVDLGQLGIVEVEAVEGRDVLLELRDAARADQGRGDSRVARRPGDRQLGQRLAAPAGQLVQRPDAAEGRVVERVRAERLGAAG